MVFFCRKNVEFGCQNVSGQSFLILTQCFVRCCFSVRSFLAEDFAFLCDPLSAVCQRHQGVRLT